MERSTGAEQPDISGTLIVLQVVICRDSRKNGALGQADAPGLRSSTLPLSMERHGPLTSTERVVYQVHTQMQFARSANPRTAEAALTSQMRAEVQVGQRELQSLPDYVGEHWAGGRSFVFG